MTDQNTVTLAINAGGKSTRMGTDKAFVELAGTPMIQHVIARTATLPVSERLIVTNTPSAYAHLGWRMVPDVIEEAGSLGGILSAIHHSDTPYTLVVACDMPFLNADLLRHMMTLTPDFDVVVPRVEGYPQGLHAIYSQACLPHIRQRIDAGRLKVIGFYESVRVRYLNEDETQRFDPDGLSFRNVNTPQELEDARLTLQKLDE